MPLACLLYPMVKRLYIEDLYASLCEATMVVTYDDSRVILTNKLPILRLESRNVR